MVDLDAVRLFAATAHAGQTRRHGAPYIEHPVAVRAWTEAIGAVCGIPVDDALLAIALLHDVIEDCGTTEAELVARFGPRVAQGVSWLTKRGDGPEAEAAYYARLSAEADDGTRLVKICDRCHNLSQLHLALATDASDARPAERANADRARRFVEGTVEHVLPLARSLTQAPGLLPALKEAIRAACRALRLEVPTAARDPAVAVERVPSGIYAIVQPEGLGGPEVLARRVRALVDGGVALVQLRMKTGTDRERLGWIEAVSPVCRAAGVPIIVNDRADLAAAAGADGVHVGTTDLPAPAVRRIVGDAALVGTSTHTPDDLNDVLARGAIDYVAVGPIHASRTKQGHADIVGVPSLAARVEASALPVVAIGGLSGPDEVAGVARAGARLAAVVSALDVDDPLPAARLLSLAFFAASGR